MGLETLVAFTDAPSVGLVAGQPTGAASPMFGREKETPGASMHVTPMSLPVADNGLNHPGLPRLQALRGRAMDKRTRYSPEVRDRAVRLVLEHPVELGSQWQAIRSIAN